MQNQIHPNNEAGAVAQERLVLRSDYVAAATMEELTMFITQRLKAPDGFDISSIDSIRVAALELCPVGKSYRRYMQSRLTHASDDADDFAWTATAEQWARSLVSAIVDVDEYCARHSSQNVKEHATPLAGASVETGDEVHVTGDVADKAASGGCVSRLVRCSYSDEEWREIETKAGNLRMSVIQYIESRAVSRYLGHERILLPPSKWYIRRQNGKVLVGMFAHRSKSGMVNMEHEILEESSLPVDLIRRVGSEYSFIVPVALQLNPGVEKVGVSVGTSHNEALVESLDGCGGISPNVDPVLLAGRINDGKVAEGGPIDGVAGHGVGVSENSSTNSLYSPTCISPCADMPRAFSERMQAPNSLEVKGIGGMCGTRIFCKTG